MKLTRTLYLVSGVFGTLVTDEGKIYYTAEHAYNSMPKVPLGTYTCLKGNHNLHSGPVIAFELQNVLGHTGILLHIGNYPQIDSDGCILVGMGSHTDNGQDGYIYGSRTAFTAFMNDLANIESFTLEIENEA
jgi:hypothetical protein